MAFDQLIQGGLWRVSDDPSVELTHWWVFETPEGDHHFNGYNHSGWDGEGRVSSKIVEFDMETKTGITRSGRKYILKGLPAYNGDAHYVFDGWLRINKLTRDDISDATGDYLTEEEKQQLR